MSAWWGMTTTTMETVGRFLTYSSGRQLAAGNRPANGSGACWIQCALEAFKGRKQVRFLSDPLSACVFTRSRFIYARKELVATAVKLKRRRLSLTRGDDA